MKSRTMLALAAAGAMTGPAVAQAEVSPEFYATGGALAPALGEGEVPTSNSAANTIPEFKSVVGTDGDTYPAPWVASCVAEAAGTDSVDELSSLNPSAFVGSGYIGKSLTRFQVRVIANDVSGQCDNVVTSRDFAVQQIYAGKSNIKGGPVHFTSLEGYDATQRVGLKAAFTCIRGKQSRGYKINATNKVGLADGTSYTFAGGKTIRGKSDGC